MALNIPVKIGKKDFFIRSDKLNFMIGYNETSVNKTNGETNLKFVAEAYYSNITSLFQDLLQRKLKESTVSTLAGLMKKQVEIETELTSVWSSNGLTEGMKRDGE